MLLRLTSPSDPTRSDYEGAMDLALRVGGDGEGASAFLRWCEIRARSRVDVRWPVIQALAALLLAERQMSSRRARTAVREVVQSALGGGLRPRA